MVCSNPGQTKADHLACKCLVTNMSSGYVTNTSQGKKMVEPDFCLTHILRRRPTKGDPPLGTISYPKGKRVP